jgi:hypothetical protein
MTESSGIKKNQASGQTKKTDENKKKKKKKHS